MITNFFLAGYIFANALNVEGDLYNWGKGDYGVLGDGNNKSQYKPVKNNYFEIVKTEDKNTIKIIKSANNYTVV